MNEHISLICSRSPKERIPLLTNILYLYGIEQKKSIYMQTFLLHTSYYVNRLISYITNTDFNVVESYMFPIGAKSKTLKQQKINAQDFVFALEKIRNANLSISSSKVFAEKDWVDYIFDFEYEYQVVVIDSFEDLLKNTKKSFKEVKRIIERYCKKYHTEILLFMDEKEAKQYDFSNWKVSYIDKPFDFTFDESNHIIDITLKEEEK